MTSGLLTDILMPATPTMGDPKAPVLLVEFSDFTCGYCGRFYRETLPPLRSTYLKSGKVRFAYRDYPRDDKGWGLVAAHAARCAGEQGKFWEMHDKLFENQAALQVADLKRRASELGLDALQFESCLDSGRQSARIAKDVEDGRRVGVSGTPTFFINGRMLNGAQSYQAFVDMIDEELNRLGSGPRTTAHQDK